MVKDNQMEYKTNAMRLLDRANIPYSGHSYADTKAVGGIDVAAALGQDENRVYKTLVVAAKSGEHYVFVIPVSKELDLKKAAKAVNEKSVEMVKAKELFPLTGYVHGGCSPIGMKKRFVTVLDESATKHDTIIFSAGKIGYQIELKPENLRKAIEIIMADVAK